MATPAKTTPCYTLPRLPASAAVKLASHLATHEGGNPVVGCAACAALGAYK